MFITDSQVHLYLRDSPEHPWPEQFRGQVREQYEYLPETLLPQMEEAGVDRAVVVPPVTSGWDNEPQIGWAQRWPEKFAVMGRFDLLDPNRERLETWTERPGLLGTRFIGPPVNQADWLDVDAHGWFYETVERLGIPVMMLPMEERIAQVNAVAERYPGATLIIDHSGTTIGDPAKIDPWAFIEDTLSLAKHPNVYAKLSALPLNTLEEYPFPSQTPYIRRLYDAFGPQRLAWGADMTRLRRSTYKQSVDHMLETIDFLSEEDKRWIMSKALSQAIHWPEPAGID